MIASQDRFDTRCSASTQRGQSSTRVPIQVTEVVQTRQTRQVSWNEYGDPTGPAVVVSHGTPGSRLQVALLGEEARSKGIRLMCLDRPGYGLTSDGPDGSWTNDVLSVLDEAQCEKAVIVGVSGGSRHAISAALAIPDRVSGLLLASAMIPGTPKRLLHGRLRGLSQLLWLSDRLPALARRIVVKQASATPDHLRRQLSALPAADRRALMDPAYAEIMGLDTREALKGSPDAVVADLKACARQDISQDLERIIVPTRILHGAQDRNVPIAAARWAQTLIPAAHLSVIPAGHHFLATHRDEWWQALASFARH